MPIDPVLLHKYDPPAAPGRPPRDGWRGLLVVAVAVAAIAAAAGTCAGWNSGGAASVVVGAVVVLSVVALVILVVVGLQEDGLLGVVYRLRHPLGTALAGDDRPSWVAHGAVLALFLCWAAALLLIVRHPAAAPWTIFGAAAPVRTTP